MIAKFATKSKKEVYHPDVLYLTVNTKINSRFFDIIDVNKSIYANPTSGSIIMEEMSADNSYDFHLVPQLVNSGTATPTKYKVVYDDSKIPPEAIAEFTFEQCFNYYNWQGAIRVPSCLQNANKLSKQMTEHLKENIKSVSLQQSFHFL